MFHKILKTLLIVLKMNFIPKGEKVWMSWKNNKISIILIRVREDEKKILIIYKLTLQIRLKNW